MIRKFSKFAIDAAIGLLLLGPAIQLFFGFVDDFVGISQQGPQSGGIINGMIGLLLGLIFFLKYGAVAFIAMRLGGTLGQLTGMVNDRARGVLDRQKKRRGAITQERGKRWKEGQLYSPNSKLGKAAAWVPNRAGGIVGGMGQPGGLLVFGKSARAARANMRTATADEYAREDANFGRQMENEDAMLAHAFRNDKKKLASLEWFQEKNDDGSIKRDKNGNAIVKNKKIEEAIAASNSIRMTGRSIFAAGDAVAKTGKGIANREEANQLFDAVSLGNDSLKGAAVGRYRWVWRQSGRPSLGRANAYESLREMSTSQMLSMKPDGAANAADDIQQLLKVKKAADGRYVQRDDKGKEVFSFSQTERDHFVDLLYSAQYNPYSNAYTQDKLRSAIAAVPGSDRAPSLTGTTDWDKAYQRYISKSGVGRSDPDPSRRGLPGVAAPMPPAPAAAPAPDTRGTGGRVFEPTEGGLFIPRDRGGSPPSS